MSQKKEANDKQSQCKYDVFISYSRRDYADENKVVKPNNFVSKVKDVLKENGFTFWFDEEGVYSGEDFAEKIITNIEASKVFLYLSTENSNSSDWTRKEIASAYELKKPIIPLRIDKSPYHRSVLFRIADLDYLEYYANPQKALADMVDSIRSHIEKMEAEKKRRIEEERRREEERKRQEEERRLKEEERRKEEERIRQEEERARAKEQEELVKHIRSTCTALNNQEAKLDVERGELLLSLSKVTDKKQHDSLLRFINTSSPIRKLLNEQNEEIREKNLGLNEAVKTLTSERDSLARQLDNERMKIIGMEQDNDAIKKSRYIYGSIITTIVLLAGIFIFVLADKVVNYRDNNIQLVAKNSDLETKNSDLEKRIDKSKSIVFRDTFAINSEKFIYTGHTNIYNQPDGDGEAFYISTQERFVGTFSKGMRKEGVYYSNDGSAISGEFGPDGLPIKDKYEEYTTHKEATKAFIEKQRQKNKDSKAKKDKK